MERYLIVECLDWHMNVTTPYHFSDCIQGMGCLFWSDFDKELLKDFQRDQHTQSKLVQVMIQFRKYINYFVEQSLINGQWGNFPHDVIALASIIIARYEMREIDNIRNKKRRPQSLKILSTWNDNLGVFKDRNAKVLKSCIMQIYSTVFDGAKFPFETEVYLDETKSNKILI